jgi:glucose-6-phosphate dehydrogenase assembly protein OpcA
MPAQPQTFSAGAPVEIGKIDRELKRLWAESGPGISRASLINLAIYSEASGSLPRNTELIARITENHACRALVIGANPGAKENRVEAWISAHCHVSRSGNKQVCCEQLSFLLEGPCSKLLPNIVFSHLDSDLPFHLWWQGEFHDPMDPQLWAWVDRLIYDSQFWDGFDAQMRRVETAQEEAKQRVVLCDLNWTRLVQLRLALAQFFDHPQSHHYLTEAESLTIEFAPKFRSTALLFTGWLAAQLGWTLTEKTKGNALTFRDQSNQPVSVSLQEKKGQPISGYTLKSGPAEFQVTHGAGADLLEVVLTESGGKRMHELMPAGSDDPVRLMSEELMRGGPHRTYLRAMNRVRDLL